MTMPETTRSDLVERLRGYAPSDGMFIRYHNRSTRQMNADIRKAADEIERSETHRNDLADKITQQSIEIGALKAEAARLRAHCEALEKAMAPFLDLGPQRGAWGVISKKLDDFAPMTLTVTKAQMLDALAAYRKETPA